MDEDETLADTLKDVLKASPSLASIFLQGKKITTSFNVASVEEKAKFEGKLFPTYFYFKKRAQGETLTRQAEEGRVARLGFETDVEDNYFGRPKEPGTYKVKYQNGEEWVELSGHSMNLFEGTASISLDLPDQVRAGEKVRIRVMVTDDQQLEPFVNEATLNITPYKKHEKSEYKKKKKKSASDKEGEGKNQPAGIELPNAIWVKETEWKEYGFDQNSAVLVKAASAEGDKRIYDFFINRANVHLMNELKSAKGNEELLLEQFRVGMLLLGMSVIHSLGKDADGEEIREKIGEFTSASALVVLPIIKHLGNLEFLTKPTLKDAA